jgi:hypothetical protein
MSLPKKIFISSSITLIIVLILWGIYTLSFKKIPEQVVAIKNPVATPAIIPQQNTNQIEQLTDEAILSPTISPDGESIKYYSKTNGKAYTLNIFSKDKQILSDTNLIGLSSIAWSPDKTKVLSKFATATDQPKFSFYDYTQNKGAQLPNNIGSVVWQNNDKIFYNYFDTKTQKGTLDMANADGSGWQKITDLPGKDIFIAPIPKTGLVSFWNRPDAFTETLMQSAPVLGGEKKDISKGKFGADYLWSPDGNSLLISSVDTKGGSKLQLSITNSLGGEYKNLNIPTLISKCVWSKTNKFVYYALPGSIPDGAVMPNDYFASGKFNTNDTFWKVDITTGEKSRLVDLDKMTGAFDAANLFLSSDEDFLFFVNRIDGKLYKITL